MDYVSRTLRHRREEDRQKSRDRTAKFLIAVALSGFLGFLLGGF